MSVFDVLLSDPNYYPLRYTELEHGGEAETVCDSEDIEYIYSLLQRYIADGCVAHFMDWSPALTYYITVHKVKGYKIYAAVLRLRYTGLVKQGLYIADINKAIQKKFTYQKLIESKQPPKDLAEVIRRRIKEKECINT